MSLFHIFFDAKSKEQINHSPKYKIEAARRNFALDANRFDLKEDCISKDVFLFRADSLTTHYTNSLEALKNERIRLAREHSFNGRNSFHFWLWVFGLVNLAFYFSCKSLYTEFTKGSAFKHHFVSITGISICFFWYIHLIFLTQKDFTKNNYVLALLISGVLCSITTYFLIKNYTYKDDIILRQLSFIERVKTIHYPKMALKARYAEKYNEALLSIDMVKDEINEFQNDLKSTTRNI